MPCVLMDGDHLFVRDLVVFHVLEFVLADRTGFGAIFFGGSASETKWGSTLY